MATLALVAISFLDLYAALRNDGKVRSLVAAVQPFIGMGYTR